jgi:hypothetical protein
MINIFSKESINLTIFIFIFIIIILLTCFSFYYILPNNYILYDDIILNNKEIKSIKEIKPVKKINVKLNPNDKYTINSNDIDNLNNMAIKINTDKENYPIKILLNNFLKSQNLNVTENTLFQSTNNSCITIINNNKNLINIEIDFYLIEEILNK